MKSRVNILLPVFNAQRTLRDCLDSLLAQTFDDFVVLAVDDGSTDRTADILLEYAHKDDRVRMINTEHSGIVPALQACFTHSDAPYLARMDADDISLPTRLEKQVALLNSQSDLAVVGCQVGPIPGETLQGGYLEYFRWINDLVEPDSISINMFVESPLPHPSVMFRRGPYQTVGGYQDKRWPEDYDLWLRMHLAGYKFGKVPEVLVYWRDHPQRASRVNARYEVDAFFQAKAFYLAQGPLRDIDEVVVWGAGKTTRQRAQYLTEYDIRIVAYVDVDPNKIGHKVRGVPVIAPEGIVDYPGRLILPFVQKRGARDDIRRMLNEAGYIEGRDYICCA